jgi:hypothetical protein
MLLVREIIADFTAKQLVGSVEYDVEVLTDDATELILDWKVRSSDTHLLACNLCSPVAP